MLTCPMNSHSSQSYVMQFSKETVQKIVEQLEGAVVTAIPGALSNATKPEDPHTPLQCKRQYQAMI